MKFDISVRIICMEKNRIATERKTYRFVFDVLRILRQLLHKRANMDFSPKKTKITALKPSIANTGSTAGNCNQLIVFINVYFSKLIQKTLDEGLICLTFSLWTSFLVCGKYMTKLYQFISI